MQWTPEIKSNVIRSLDKKIKVLFQSQRHVIRFGSHDLLLNFIYQILLHAPCNDCFKCKSIYAHLATMKSTLLTVPLDLCPARCTNIARWQTQRTSPKLFFPMSVKNAHTYVLVTGTHSDTWMVCYGGQTNKLHAAYWRKWKKKDAFVKAICSTDGFLESFFGGSHVLQVNWHNATFQIECK